VFYEAGIVPLMSDGVIHCYEIEPDDFGHVRIRLLSDDDWVYMTCEAADQLWWEIVSLYRLKLEYYDYSVSYGSFNVLIRVHHSEAENVRDRLVEVVKAARKIADRKTYH